MTQIEISNAGDYVINGYVDKEYDVSPDIDSKKAGISKRRICRTIFNNDKLLDVISKAVSGVVIDVQKLDRQRFDTLEDNSMVTVNFASPSTRVKTRAEQIDELTLAFRRAGLPEDQARELATKAVDNPELIS